MMGIGRLSTESAEYAKYVIAWGSCASNGCVQAAHPNPTGAVPVHKVIHDKPVVNVPGASPGVVPLQFAGNKGWIAHSMRQATPCYTAFGNKAKMRR